MIQGVSIADGLIDDATVKWRIVIARCLNVKAGSFTFTEWESNTFITSPKDIISIESIIDVWESF